MTARDLLIELIRFPSVSSTSNVAITEHAADRLESIGFTVESVDYVDDAGIPKRSIVAKRSGTREAETGGFAYFGHTDVVPVSSWHGADPSRNYDPADAFEPEFSAECIYGRGACDMKGSIAAAIAACAQNTSHRNPIYVILTADEETGMQGASTVASDSVLYRELVTRDVAGVIGEPTDGSVIHGHKGIAYWRATASGRAGHSSRDEGESATLKLIPFLSDVRDLATRLESDIYWADDRYEPPTLKLNVVLHDAAPAVNVTSAEASASILARLSPDTDVKQVDEYLRASADKAGVHLTPCHARAALYRNADDPYVLEASDLLSATSCTTVPYGTDGSCFGSLRRILVYGPGDIAHAHTAEEHIREADLARGVRDFATLINHFGNR